MTNIFADANGATADNQALELNSAALVRADTSTYLIISEGTTGFQGANDLVINLTSRGSIPVNTFFV